MIRLVKILELLDLILQKVREDNPHKLVLKGGTSLALHHLKGHRESEDLDFDVDISKKGSEEEIAEYLIDLLRQLESEGAIKGFKITKKGMAATDRYHMNIKIITYKEVLTKVDLDFVRLPTNLEYEGELGFYSIERMFVGKLLSFSSRRLFKDLYDIAHLLKNVESISFTEPEKLSDLIDKVLIILEKGELIESYKAACRNIDLRFKDLKEPQVKPFVEKTIRKLRMFRNELRKIASKSN